MTNPTRSALTAAIRLAKKKISLQSRSARNENLENAADDMAEAYEIGVEEGQREITRRLTTLLHTLCGEPATRKPKK